MSKRVAVILSGAGVYDGSELGEAVLLLLALDRAGAEYQCFAPDIPQHHVVNHLTGEETDESRNVLVEAARVARGEIKPLDQLTSGAFDALVMPGGFGVAKNLSDFAFSGSNMQVQKDTVAAAKQFAGASKPIGMMCIAPVLAHSVFGEGVKVTVGEDNDVVGELQAMGAVHVPCAADNIVVDEQNKLVTTPAFMSAKRLGTVATGAERLVNRVLKMVN